LAKEEGVLVAINSDAHTVHDFGNLDYARTMRLVVPGATLTALGFQTFLSAFLLSFLDLQHR
jgi:hypothetical protein